jgi:hypothetical protein
MASAKARLEEELGKLESLLRLLDDYEQTKNEQTLILLSQKLKVIVPELRQLSLDPQYKTPECAPLLVTLGQGVKVTSNACVLCFEFFVFIHQLLQNAVQRTRGITLPSPPSSTTQSTSSAPPTLAEPKPLRGFLKVVVLVVVAVVVILQSSHINVQKRGDKGLVRNYKLRYFEQRGEKIMYFRSNKDEDMKQAIGWIDLSKMVTVVCIACQNVL